MNDIFFSLITDFIFISLFIKGSVVKTIYENNFLSHSDNFIAKLYSLIRQEKIRLKDVERIFFVLGPGGQTGERISLSFVTAMKILNPNIQLFSLDSLTFQANLNQNCLSAVSVGKNSKKYYLDGYENGKLFLKERKIEKEAFNRIIENFKNLTLFLDYKDVDFLNCFQNLKVKFLKFEEFD
jgi:tRNA threonylcarbamoyladenosine biosynthesis protein TsaB